jgi:hypothetical protein
MRSKYFGAGGPRLARRIVLIAFSFNSIEAHRDINPAGLLSFCRECDPLKLIV